MIDMLQIYHHPAHGWSINKQWVCCWCTSYAGYSWFR